MNRKHLLPDGSVMVDNDPYIVYNEEMEQFASDIFREAESKGYKTDEERAKYLTAKLYKMPQFGTFGDGSIDKNAVELFNSLKEMDYDGRTYLPADPKPVLQRALLESQGIRTRNHIYELIPFTYPYKDTKSIAMDVKNKASKFFQKGVINLIRNQKNGINMAHPHFTTDIESCQWDGEEEVCEWKTIDGTFDNPERIMTNSFETDPDYIIGESTPDTVAKYKREYIDKNMYIRTLMDIIEFPENSFPPLPMASGVGKSIQTGLNRFWLCPSLND